MRTLRILQIGRRVAEWSAILLDKGLRVNAGKSKVVVDSSGGKSIVNSGKWPWGVCGKGVQANSVRCTICKKKLMHKLCSGVCADCGYLMVSGVGDVMEQSKQMI